MSRSRLARPASVLGAAAMIAGPLAAQLPSVIPAFAVSAPWRVNGSAIGDFTIGRDSTVASEGRTSLRIAAQESPDGFAGALTVLPATGTYAGHRVRVTAMLRTAALGPRGGALWVRADDAADRALAFATTQGQRAITGTAAWSPVSVELAVPTGAARLYFGVFSTDRGTLWVDDVRLEVLPGDAGIVTTAPVQFGFETATSLVQPATTVAAGTREAARPIAGRGLDNLVAFTRLLGYVRLFHPSDAAAATNWDAFAVHGMRAVEAAPNADSLARTLRALFAPVAPTVAIYRSGGTPPRAMATPAPSPSLGVVFWRHFGFKGETDSRGNVYDSRRVRVDALPDGRPKAASLASLVGVGQDSIVPPDPRYPLHTDLGGGVSASVPLALYTTEPWLTDSVAHPAPAGETFSARDRATRLADVALYWTVMQHFYPYFDRVHTNWPAELRTALTAAATDADGAAFVVTMRRLSAALHDGHAGVYGASGDVPPRLRVDLVEGRVVVSAVGDSVEGIARGDEIVSVDGRPAARVLADAAALVSGSTDRWVRSRALEQMLAGPAGTSVTLTVRDPLDAAAAPRDVREVRLLRGGTAPSETRPPKIGALRSGVMYVDLSRITDDDFTKALPDLRTASAVVFDMRGYPRTVNTPRILALLADSALHSARFEVPVITRPDGVGVVYRDGGWPVAHGDARLPGRAIFLTGGGAISYAETTMEMVEAYRLGPIVGEGTAGTNGNVDSMTLPGGFGVVWTGMRVRKHDGSPYHGVGVAPTVPASRTLAGVRAGRDEVLERALRLLDGPPTS